MILVLDDMGFIWRVESDLNSYSKLDIPFLVKKIDASCKVIWILSREGGITNFINIFLSIFFIF